MIVEGVCLLPVLGSNGKDRRNQGLQNDDVDHKLVQHPLHVAHLGSARLGIEHDLGLLASVAADRDDPIRVLKISSFEQELILRESKILILDPNGPFEGVQVLVGGLHGQVSVDSQVLSRVLRPGFEILVNIFALNALFQILFSV